MRSGWCGRGRALLDVRRRLGRAGCAAAGPWGFPCTVREAPCLGTVLPWDCPADGRLCLGCLNAEPWGGWLCLGCGSVWPRVDGCVSTEAPSRWCGRQCLGYGRARLHGGSPCLGHEDGRLDGGSPCLGYWSGRRRDGWRCLGYWSGRQRDGWPYPGYGGGRPRCRTRCRRQVVLGPKWSVGGAVRDTSAGEVRRGSVRDTSGRSGAPARAGCR